MPGAGAKGGEADQKILGCCSDDNANSNEVTLPQIRQRS